MNTKYIGWLLAFAIGATAGVAINRRMATRVNGQTTPSEAKPTTTATSPAAPASAAMVPVSIVRARQQDVPVVIDQAASVVSLNTVAVHAQIASTVRNVSIKEGQFVRKGDVLFTFDDRSDRANADKARAQLVRDKATTADAEHQWRRAQELQAQNFVAQSAVDTARAQYESQQAALVADEAAVRAAEVALSYNTVRAPLSGRAGALNIYAGSLVQPGGDPLVTISQIDPIGISFSVPEADLPALLKGLRTGSAVQALGTSEKIGAAATASATTTSSPLSGKLSFVDNTIDSATGTVHAKAEIPNAQNQLWPGQYVTARMALRVIKAAIVIPQVALIQRGEERGVYVVDANNVVQWRRINLAYAYGEWAVVEGLHADERVVNEGKQNVRPGGTIKESAPSSTASGAAQ